MSEKGGCQMQRNKLMGVVALLLCIGMMIPSVSAQAATTI